MSPSFRRRRLSLPASGVEIALLDFGGEGPLALLHHANGFCAALWSLVARGLREHFRVVAMDARGHGDSSRPEGAGAYAWENFGADAMEVAEILAAEAPEGRVGLGLGHSFGSTALLTAAARRPALFERLVCVDPIIRPPMGFSIARRPGERGPDLAEGARKRRHVWPDREEARASWSQREFFSDWLPEALALYVSEGLRDRDDGQVELKCPGEIEATIFESAPQFDSWGVACRVRAPVLIQWAARGDFPRAHFEQLAAEMHDARVCDADSGHLVPMERPDLVIEAVLGFARAGA